MPREIENKSWETAPQAGAALSKNPGRDELRPAPLPTGWLQPKLAFMFRSAKGAAALSPGSSELLASRPWVEECEEGANPRHGKVRRLTEAPSTDTASPRASSVIGASGFTFTHHRQGFAPHHS